MLDLALHGTEAIVWWNLYGLTIVPRLGPQKSFVARVADRLGYR